MKTADERTALIESLHRKYAGVIFDSCMRILKDRARAEDAVQECFISAYRGLDTFSFGVSHLPWLYRIATNTCLKIIRKDKRRQLQMMSELITETAGRNSDQESCLNARFMVERLDSELDDRTREILVSHFILGMDQGQIATTMGISRRAVVKRVTQLRKLVISLWPEVSHD